MTRLDANLASHMARIAFGHVTKEYPHKLDHVLVADEDAKTPRMLHPIFSAASTGTAASMAGGRC